MASTPTDKWDALFEGEPIAADVGQLRKVDRTRQTASTSGVSKRLDIQGLRALAVLLVIGDHFFGWPNGGFVGVDVFFVISGFLITSLLVRSAERGGGVSAYFGHFYEGRARRILPAAVTTLAASWIAASLIFRGVRIHQAHVDILWALGFSANIHFARIGTDYFQATRSQSPVQHYWSLAVEEQFYVVWPVLLFIVIAVFARQAQARLLLLLAILSVLTTASIAWALHATSADATSAYFSTPARAFELGAGALLAVALARRPNLAVTVGRARGPLVIVALAGVVMSALFIGSLGPFPAPAAVAPVLATTLAIFVGSGSGCRATVWNWVLTNRLSTYVGEISYSLYLWHWPVLIFAEALLPKATGIRDPLLISITVALAVLSYNFVEQPFRRSAADDATNYPPVRVQALLAVTLAVVGAGLYTMRPGPTQPPTLAAGTVSRTDLGEKDATAATDRAPASKRLAAEIRAAVNATAFPRLRPGLNGLGAGNAQRDVWSECNTGDSLIDSCIFRPKSIRGASHAKRALVIGDSIAVNWVPVVRDALVSRGWTVYGFARGECPAAYVGASTKLNGGPLGAKSCDRHHAALAEVLREAQPSLVIVSNTEETPYRMAGDAAGLAAVREYEAGMVKTLKLVSSSDRSVITLSPPPIGRSLLDCDTAGSTPADCLKKVSQDWYTLSEADRAATKAAGARYVNTESWFCTEDDYCPAFVSSVPVTYDGVHITTAYAAKIAPEFAGTLRL